MLALRGFCLLALQSRYVQQVQMVSRFATICGDVNPVLHQQRVLGMLHRDMRAIAHHNREGHEWRCRQHLLQFCLHDSYS